MKFYVTGGDYIRRESLPGKRADEHVVYRRGDVVESASDLEADFPNAFMRADDEAEVSTPVPQGEEGPKRR